jgi:hypothetical protein
MARGIHFEVTVHQRLESEFLQHGYDWQQLAVGSQIVPLKS